MRESDRFGRYRIIKEIGTGSTATVYHAVDGGDEVAIKVLHEHLSSDAVIRERLRREVEIAQRIEHAGLLKIYDFLTWRERVGIVMEYCPGGNLSGWIAGSPGELEARAREISAALGALHRAGVVHRDLKPENLLIGEDGSLRLGDFGSAHIQNLLGLTTSTMFLSSSHYLPLEVSLGEKPDPRWDIYALGGILYYAATGKSHIASGTSSLLLHSATPPAPSSLNEEIPGWLSDLILDLLGPSQNRPPDGSALLSLLKRQSFQPRVREKRCLFCHSLMPGEAGICLSCGRKELVIIPYHGEDAEFLVLKKVSEDTELLNDLSELLRGLSRSQTKTFTFLTDDIRLYSKEEKKRGIQLPVRIMDNLAPSITSVLFDLFSSISSGKIRLTRYPMKKIRRVKRGPLIDPKDVVFHLQAAEDFLRKAVVLKNSEKETTPDGIFYRYTGILYRLIERSKNRGSEEDFADLCQKLLSEVHKGLKHLNSIESFLDTLSLGEIYVDLKRLEGKIDRTDDSLELEDLIKRKVKRQEDYGKYQELEARSTQLRCRLMEFLGVLETADSLPGKELISKLVKFIEDFKGDQREMI